MGCCACADAATPHSATARLRDNSFLVGAVDGSGGAVIGGSWKAGGGVSMLRAHTHTEK